MEVLLPLIMRPMLHIRVKVAVILSVSLPRDATVMLLDLEHVFSTPQSWLQTLTQTLPVHTPFMMLLAPAADWSDMMLAVPTHFTHRLMQHIRHKVGAVVSVCSHLGAPAMLLDREYAFYIPQLSPITLLIMLPAHTPSMILPAQALDTDNNVDYVFTPPFPMYAPPRL
jgi:hypothetical protein